MVSPQSELRENQFVEATVAIEPIKITDEQEIVDHYDALMKTIQSDDDEFDDQEK